MVMVAEPAHEGRVDSEGNVLFFDSLHRYDDATTGFFQRELEQVEAKLYKVLYPELCARRVFPVDKSDSNGAEFLTWYQFDKIGLAKTISDYAKDFPEVTVTGERHTTEVKGTGASYGYSVQEIRAASLAGRSLQPLKAEAARRAIEDYLNRAAFVGIPGTKLPSLMGNPNVTRTIPVPDGTNGSTNWRDKSNAQILRDMNQARIGMVSLTQSVHTPNMMLLPTELYEFVRLTPFNINDSRSILKVFMQNQGPEGIRRVMPVNELTNAGTNGTDVMVTYQLNATNMAFKIPQDFEVMMTQQVGMTYKKPCHARTGGLIIRYPLSVSITEGI